MKCRMRVVGRLTPGFLLVAAALLGACAAGTPAVQQPEGREAQPSPRDDGRAQLVRTLDTLKQPGVEAETETQGARSVIEAIGGSPEMQGDGGLRDH